MSRSTAAQRQDIAFITVTAPDGDPQDASAGRSYNLTAIDPKSGEILDVRLRHLANEFEADNMAAFIEPAAGTIVLGTRHATMPVAS